MKIAYSETINAAYNSIKEDLALVAGLTLVNFMGAAAFSRIPGLGIFVSFPLAAGYLRCLLKIRARESIGYGDFFWGFLNFNRFLHLVLAHVLVTLGTIIGTVLLIVPGLWWLIASIFTLQNMVVQEVDSISAIKASLKMVEGRWWNICGFSIVLLLINLLGALCFFVGLFLTMPITVLAAVLAAEALLRDPQVASALASMKSATAVDISNSGPSTPS